VATGLLTGPADNVFFPSNCSMTPTVACGKL
jgi:hypothetical protein